jgi:hypothetical protein
VGAAAGERDGVAAGEGFGVLAGVTVPPGPPQPVRHRVIKSTVRSRRRGFPLRPFRVMDFLAVFIGFLTGS